MCSIGAHPKDCVYYQINISHFTFVWNIHYWIRSKCCGNTTWSVDINYPGTILMTQWLGYETLLKWLVYSLWSSVPARQLMNAINYQCKSEVKIIIVPSFLKYKTHALSIEITAEHYSIFYIVYRMQSHLECRKGNNLKKIKYHNEKTRCPCTNTF